MSKIDVISDLSNKKICEIPKYILDLTNLKMLYLEGNAIEVVPDELFTTLLKMVWLDLRKNKLTTLPKTIAHHPSLETLLLRDNSIEKLPLELGLVPKLKVLQVSCNPLIYPKKEIIQEGVKSITDFLRKEYENKHQPEKPNPFLSEIKCVLNEKNTSDNHMIKGEEPVKVYKPVKLKTYRKENKGVTVKSHKLRASLSKLCQKDHPHYNSSRYLNMLQKRKNDVRVEEKNYKDTWMKKLADIMATQEQVLQKQRDIETLKMWRQNLKYQSPNIGGSYDLKSQVPYDYDEEYDKIPTRKELNSNMTLSRKVRRTTPKPRPNIDRLIGDIMASLESMTQDKQVKRSPRSQMEKAGRDIKKIVDLQKRLSMLKLVITRDNL